MQHPLDKLLDPVFFVIRTVIVLGVVWFVWQVAC